jgi:hypothetical protein
VQSIHQFNIPARKLHYHSLRWDSVTLSALASIVYETPPTRKRSTSEAGTKNWVEIHSKWVRTSAVSSHHSATKAQLKAAMQAYENELKQASNTQPNQVGNFTSEAVALLPETLNVVGSNTSSLEAVVVAENNTTTTEPMATTTRGGIASISLFRSRYYAGLPVNATISGEQQDDRSNVVPFASSGQAWSVKETEMLVGCVESGEFRRGNGQINWSGLQLRFNKLVVRLRLELQRNDVYKRAEEQLKRKHKLIRQKQ